MKQLLKSYKLDILFLISITIIFGILSALFSKYYVDMWIDLGREAYFPELMLKGKLLYKDLFNIFGPFGYQINAVLYKIMGIKISTLGIAGNFCSVLILYFTYFISRVFLNVKLSSFITVFVLFTCVFSPGVFNFIYPYSYSLLYAYMTFLGAVLFFLLAFKNKENDLYLFICYFFMGISTAAKFEYTPFIPLLILYSIFIRKQSLSKMLINISLLLIVPLLSYGYLFYQGVTINDFINNFYYLKKYVFSSSLHYFYSHYVGTIFSFALLKKFLLNEFFISLTFILIYSVCFYAIAVSSDKPKYIKPEYIVIAIGIILSGAVYPGQLYLIVPYILYAIFLYEVFKKIKNKEYNFLEDIYFLFIVISIIFILKTFFILDVDFYGSFTITLPFIAIIIFLANKCQKISKKFMKNDLDNLLSSVIVILLLAGFSDTYGFIFEKIPSIRSEKADFYILPIISDSIGEMYDYIENNIPKSKSLMLIPEGVFINYAAGRELKLYNYQSLLSPYIDTFGVDNIINDIRNAKIDYIIIVPRSDVEYGGDYAMCAIVPEDELIATKRKEERKLCSYIQNEYDLAKNIENLIFIYKIKNRI